MLVTFSKELSKCPRFDAHDRQIDAKEEGGEQDPEDPPAGTDGKSET
jgi:hypothetical protein